MSSPEAVNVIAEETFLYIARQSSVNGVNYNNLFITGVGIEDVYDPDAKISPILVAGYWPGGIDAAGHQYLMHGVGNYAKRDMHDERIFMRTLLRGAVLNPSAVDRHRQRMSPEERTIEQAGELGTIAVKAFCTQRQAPLSYVMVSTVVQSDKIESGKKVGILYYPGGLTPEASLEELREQVGRVITEEIV